MNKSSNIILRIAMVMSILFVGIQCVYCFESEIILQEMPFPVEGDNAWQSGSNPTHPNEFRAFVDSDNNKITIYPNVEVKSDIQLQIVSTPTFTVVYDTYFSDSISVNIYISGDYLMCIYFNDKVLFGNFKIGYTPKTQSVMSDVFKVEFTEDRLKISYKDIYDNQQLNALLKSNLNICLFNSSGDMVLQTTNKEINTSKLYSGIYMLLIATDIGWQTEKIYIR